MTLSTSNVVIALATGALSFAVDQASKFYVLRTLGLDPGEAVTMIPGVLTFVMAWNHGINFGIRIPGIDNAGALLAGLAIVVSIAMMVWAARHPRDGIFAVAVGLIVGGALGNGYDRIVYGAVADFLNVTCCGVVNPFAFNIADVAIFLGVAILLLRPSEQADGAPRAGE